MRSIHFSGAVLALLLGACSAPPPPVATGAAATVDAVADGDAAPILAHMRATWDRPDAPLEAGPVVVEGDYAVADWTQADKGGRALLRRMDGAWTTWLCAGDGIRDAAGLIEVGVPEAQAKALAERLAVAERQVSRDRLAKMASFAGVVRMHAQHDAHEQHDAHDKPH